MEVVAPAVPARFASLTVRVVKPVVSSAGVVSTTKFTQCAVRNYRICRVTSISDTVAAFRADFGSEDVILEGARAWEWVEPHHYFKKPDSMCDRHRFHICHFVKLMHAWIQNAVRPVSQLLPSPSKRSSTRAAACIVTHPSHPYRCNSR